MVAFDLSESDDVRTRRAGLDLLLIGGQLALTHGLATGRSHESLPRWYYIGLGASL